MTTFFSLHQRKNWKVLLKFSSKSPIQKNKGIKLFPVPLLNKVKLTFDYFLLFQVHENAKSVSSVARSTTTQSTTIKTTTATTQKPTLVVRQLYPRAPKSYFIKPSNFFGQKVPPGGGNPQLHSNEIDIDNKVAEERHDHYYAKHPPRSHWKKPPPARYIPCGTSMIEQPETRWKGRFP